MKSSDHRALFDPEQNRWFQCGCCAYAKRLPHEGSFTQKVAGTQHNENGLFSPGRDDRHLHFARLDKEDSVRLIALSKYRFTCCDVQDALAIRNFFEKVRYIWIFDRWQYFDSRGALTAFFADDNDSSFAVFPFLG